MQANIQQLQAHNKIIENQLAQIAQQVGSLSLSPSGHFPSSTVVNPKEQDKAITLRLGRGYEGSVMSEEEPQKGDEGVVVRNEDDFENEIVDVEKKKKQKNDKGVTKESEGDEERVEKPPMKVYKPPIPFPHRIVEKKSNEKLSNFLEVMRGLQLNIPFLHAMSQMPTYAKFLKDLLSNKSRLEESATISLPKEVKVIIQNKLPQKFGDPGSYAIPVKIGDMEAMDALCDLGESVSLMPYSIAKSLKVGDLKPTRMSLQLADRTVRLPLGILEDVPVQVGRVFVPCDTVVMEMEEDTTVPLILGRPFLNTAGVVIDIKQGRLTLNVGDEKISFSFPQALKKPLYDEVHRVDTLERDLEKFQENLFERDPLQAILTGGLVEESEETRGYDLLLNQPLVHNEMKVEVLNVEVKEEMTTPPHKVELKPLPPLLKYAFLDDSESYPVIFNANLDDTSLGKLLDVLREYRDVIGLKEALISGPIIQPPNWELPFELMCDASDFAIRSVLRQRKDKKLHAIYYTIKTLDDAQRNYTTTEKEFLAIVHAIEKFRSYLLGSKVIVFTDIRP
ncbi:uncharacterized protein LOC110708896 [Chenopodium quinoa]|uniref:uncharacterized protein LOC110708896 n=1 Tax=Chenopodium quinoa TaxID=63459 RepID=UPI000B7915B1|nr:uncharacterized protein LOC110708896 [Chenopodium quinoa]